MGAVRPASRMRPVELVDEDDDLPWSSGSSARDRAPGGHGRARPEGVPGDDALTDRRRWWPWVLGVLVVAVGAAAVATGVTERAARERADAFAALPGVVRPLEAAPVERWRAAADGPTPVMAAGGAVVTVSGAQDSWTVRSADAATGAVRWQVPVVPRSGAGFESVAVACTTDTAAAPVLCIWQEPNVVYGSSGESTPYVPPTQVLALDAGDGARRGSWEIDGRLLGAVRHDDDVLVATALPDRHVLVRRHGGVDGVVQWSWTSPIPLVDDGGVRAIPRLTISGDVLSLVAISTTLLDAPTGAVLDAGSPGRQILVAALPDGGYATWEPSVGGELRDSDGDVRGLVPALPLPVVGDASVDGLLIDVGNRALAVRASDGVPRWRLATSMSPVAVAHGVVVMAGDASVGAVDGADGRLLWEQELLTEQRVAPVTDGLHVLTAEPDGAGGHQLVARGLRDGVETWRVDLPADLVDLTAVGGHVVARTTTEAVVLG